MRDELNRKLLGLEFSIDSILHGLHSAVERRKLTVSGHPDSRSTGEGPLMKMDSRDMPDHRALLWVRAPRVSSRSIPITAYRNQADGSQGAEIVVPDKHDENLYVVIAQQELRHITEVVENGEDTVVVARIRKNETLLKEPLPRDLEYRATPRPALQGKTRWPLLPGYNVYSGSWRDVNIAGIHLPEPGSVQTVWTSKTFINAGKRLDSAAGQFRQVADNIPRPRQ